MKERTGEMVKMDLDERIGIEQDHNLMTGPVKKTIRLTTLLLIIGQYEQTGDTNQLIEDLDTLGIEVRG